MMMTASTIWSKTKSRKGRKKIVKCLFIESDVLHTNIIHRVSYHFNSNEKWICHRNIYGTHCVYNMYMFTMIVSLEVCCVQTVQQSTNITILNSNLAIVAIEFY